METAFDGVPDDGAGHVAIVGMAGRFPGAEDIATFWDNLVQGREGIRALTDDDLRGSGVGADESGQPGYVRAKGVLRDADRFDAAFFGFSPREAELLDPQQRAFLECAWHALEDAGRDPATAGGRIGVFAGSSLNSYLLFNLLANRVAADAAGSYQTLLASDKDFLATRVSYKLGLTGPSVTVQTACSTSLSAVHLACQSLLNGECDTALAGGVSVSVPLAGGYVYQPGGILSPDGHCRAFDADAAGTVAGNGVGAVVLRRLDDARRDGDAITAVIRGTAMNNDGSRKAGYTAPGLDGQAEVIAEALAVAGVDAGSVGYVETHGTGTALGDPIELAALTKAFRHQSDRAGYCAIGSVKSNVGHLDAAAGVTALIKAALVLRNEAIPPTLHVTRPSPALQLGGSPFVVNTQLRPWPRTDVPRRAGVSSFGIGGTNVHVVLEEAPALPAAGGGHGRAVYVLALSGRTPDALAAAAGRLTEHLERPGAEPVDLSDVERTLARRRAFEHRAAVTAGERSEAVAALRRLAAAPPSRSAGRDAPVAFLFPGQGSQHAGMARELYRAEPVFARELDRCAELAAGHLGADLRALILDAGPDADEQLRQTAVAQPALFAVEYALAGLWQSWGIRPRAMAGHSVGEYVAACLAGVFALQDAVRLVAVRGRLVQSMPAGSMLAVFLPEAELAGWLDERLCLAAVNTSGVCAVAGPAEAIADLRGRLSAAGIANRGLHTSHAFHSPSMEPAVEPLAREVAAVARHAPEIPFVSNVTGTWITDEQATDPHYWGRHLRAPVRFADAVARLLEEPELVLLEVGPGRTLTDLARRHAAWTADRVAVRSLPHPGEDAADARRIARAAGELWSAGAPLHWAAYTAGEPRPVVPLPGYPFQRRRYWIDPDPAHAPAPAAAAGDGGPRRAEEIFSAPGWRRLPAGAGAVPAGSVVVLGADSPIGAALADRLAAAGSEVVRVGAATQVSRRTDGGWNLDPGRREHYAELFAALPVGPIHVVHAWSLTGDADRELGFDALLALAQGLGDVRVAAAIDVVCHGVLAVTGDEPLEPEYATLLGPATVIPQELTGVTCRLLDVTGADPASAAGPLAALLARDTDERVLALRGRHWWAREFDPLPTAGGTLRLRDGGRYLITGGLGGVGLALAEEIAEHVKEPVLGLLGRTALVDGPDDAGSAVLGRLRALRERGARVVLLVADVTDAERLATEVHRLRDGVALHGVIHAAGVPSAGLIAGKTRAEAGAVLAAKTRGTLALRAACGDVEDFVLLCSSLTAVLGGPGQSDYAAANAFLDAYAQLWRRETGAPVVSVAWDTWQGVGMAAGLAERLGGGRPGGHPLLRLVERTDRSATYRTTFSTADSWIVDEHRIMGHGLVPGTAYLELVRAALADRAPGRALDIRDVVFTLPVIVPDGQIREVYTTVEQHGETWRFAVRSRAADGWQEHAGGEAGFAEAEPGPPADLGELVRGCDVVEVLDTEETLKRRLKLDRVEQGGPIRFTFGPRWRCLRRIEAGRRRLMVTLELDPAYHADLDDYALHPALLDVAGAAARIHATDIYYLPVTYRRLCSWAPLTATVHCLVDLAEPDPSGETLTCDIDLLDPSGRRLARAERFTIKRIQDVPALIAAIDDAAAEPAAPPAGALQRLARGMSERDARSAFVRLLAAAELPEHVVVSAYDLAALRRLAGSITPESLVAEAAAAPPVAAVHPRPELATPYVAPRDDDERAVAAIWQEVLGVERVGVDDDFFALGGHSLAAVQVGAKLQRHFGVQLDLRDFFDGPTVSRTAAALTAGRAAPGEADAIPRLERDTPGYDEDLADLSDEEVDARLRDLLAEEMKEQGENA
ncbi:beta-ketoacyl synthase N-terminal-like domain-containing protein [Dactylosporangium sp. CA-233914]|uniref:type I polyketide synthase n=1 Tax=Dactylosporangium sp. CA-233914 TaxID=3239934 RepID=UPI003D93FA2E